MARTHGSTLPVIEELQETSPPVLKKSPRCQILVQCPSDEDSNELSLNQNSNSRGTHQAQSDSCDSDEELKPQAPRNKEATSDDDDEATEDLGCSAKEYFKDVPSWDTMLSHLNKLNGSRVLALADLRATILCHSAWKIPYGEALGHILMAWQNLRAGSFVKDCRMWLRKNIQSRTFKDAPFTSAYGLAGFCIRKKRKSPEVSNTNPENRMERLRNHLIEYTGFTQTAQKIFVKRINSKKDERTERYKGTKWQDYDPILARWDNTGFHKDGQVEVGTYGVSDVLDETATNLIRHRSLPPITHTVDLTTLCIIKKITGSMDQPPAKRHCSDSALVIGKGTGCLHERDLDFNPNGHGPSPQSSDEMTKEELWNRALDEKLQNITSNNARGSCESIDMNNANCRESSNDSLASTDLSFDGSLDADDDEDDKSSELQCQCDQCVKERRASTPDFLIKYDLVVEPGRDDSSSEITVDTDQEIREMHAVDGLIRLRNEVIVSKLQTSLKLSDTSVRDNNTVQIICEELDENNKEEEDIEKATELDDFCGNCSAAVQTDEEIILKDDILDCLDEFFGSQLQNAGSTGFQPSVEDTLLSGLDHNANLNVSFEDVVNVLNENEESS